MAIEIVVTKEKKVDDSTYEIEVAERSTNSSANVTKFDLLVSAVTSFMHKTNSKSHKQELVADE